MTSRHLILLTAAAFLHTSEVPAQDEVTAIVRIVDAKKKPIARPDWRLRARGTRPSRSRLPKSLPRVDRHFSGSETKLSGLRRGDSWYLVVDAPGLGRVTRHVFVEGRSQTIDITLPAPLPASSVQLRIVDVRGRPVSGIPLEVQALTRSMEVARKARHTANQRLLTTGDVHRGVTDASGGFLTPVPSEDWGRIFIRWGTRVVRTRDEHPSRTLGVVRFGRLEPGQRAESSVVVLGLEHLASGRVVDASWAPRKDVRVRLAIEDAESALGQAMKDLGQWEVTTDRERRFAFWFPAALEQGELEVFEGVAADPRTKIVRKAFVRGAEGLVIKLD